MKQLWARRTLLWGIGWWYLKRRLRKRAARSPAYVTEASAPPRKRHLLRRVLLVAGLGLAAVKLRHLCRRKTDDGWTMYQPSEPAAAPPPLATPHIPDASSADESTGTSSSAPAPTGEGAG